MTSTPKELNNTKNSNSILGKRKKVREKRSNYLQKWLEKTIQNTPESIPATDMYDPLPYSVPGSYYNYPVPVYNQRLFNATSDPSVFRYSTPYNYHPEPISLPPYPPPFHPVNSNIPEWGPYNTPKLTPQGRSNRSHKKFNSVNRKNTFIGIENEFNRMQNGHGNHNTHSTPNPGMNGRNGSGSNASSVAGVNHDFASLPPGVNNCVNVSVEDNDDGGNQRRFSDPGLAQSASLEPSQESAEESDSESSSVMDSALPDNRLIMCLVDQINSLKESNRKLYKELHETRGELDALKQQSGVWRGDSASSRLSPQLGLSGSSAVYAPGMLADLVRDIRDAARVREEALYNKVRLLLDERSSNKVNGNPPPEKNYGYFRNNYDHNMKNLVNPGVAEKSRTNDRLGKLEEELQNLRLQQSREDGLPSPLLSQPGPPPELERQRLQTELQEERNARRAADAHALKLELLVTHLRSKRGVNQAMGAGSGGGGTSTGAMPSDTLHMVLGPVTDL